MWPSPGDPGLGDAGGALRALQELLRMARRVGWPGSDDDVLGRASSLACELLGYRACAIAVRADDGDFEYRSCAGAALPDGEFIGRALPAAAYASLCQAATTVEGSYWLSVGHPVGLPPEVSEVLLALCTPMGTGPEGEGVVLWAPMVGGDGSSLGFVIAGDASDALVAQGTSSSETSPTSGDAGGSERPSPSPFQALLLETLAEVAAVSLDMTRALAAQARSGRSAPRSQQQLGELNAGGADAPSPTGLHDGLTGIAQSMADLSTDDLTGLANRSSLLERAPEMVLAARRSGLTTSALYVDIDHFKDINDSFGSATGDEVIAAVGQTIANRLRRGDLLARFGGQEFVAVLPGTALEEATALAEEIRRLVAGGNLVPVNPPLELHVSIGVAALRPGEDAEILLASAAAALSQAKRAGRDRVWVAPA